MASMWSKTPLSPGQSQLNTHAYPDFFTHYGPMHDSNLVHHKPSDLDLNTSWNFDGEIYYRDGLPDDESLVASVKRTVDMGTQTVETELCLDPRHQHLENYCLVPIQGPLSPTSDYASPTSPKSFQFPTSPSPLSPVSRSKRFDFNLNSFAADFATKASVESRKKQQHHNTFCGFCYNNARVNGCDVNGQGRWLEHNLRDTNGRVTCPCLRMFQCPICGGSGDDAHTQRHCPKRNRAK